MHFISRSDPRELISRAPKGNFIRRNLRGSLLTFSYILLTCLPNNWVFGFFINYSHQIDALYLGASLKMH